MEKEGKDKIIVLMFVIFLAGAIIFSNAGYDFKSETSIAKINFPEDFSKESNLITGMATLQGIGDKGVSTDGIGCDFCLGDVEKGLCINNGGTDGWCDWQNRDSGDKDYNYMHQAPTGEKWVTGDFVFVTREAWWKGNIFNAREYTKEELVGVDIDGKIITQMFELDDNGLFNVINSGETSEVFLNILQDKFYICFIDGTCLDLSYFESFPPYQGATCITYSGGPRFREALMLPENDVGVSGFDIKCTLSGIYNSGPKYFVSVGGCSNDAECGYNKRCGGGTCQPVENSICDYKKITNLPSDSSVIKLLDGTIKTRLELNNDFTNAWGTPNNNKVLIIGDTYIKKISDVEFWIDSENDCDLESGCGISSPECSGQCYLDSALCNMQSTCSWNGVNCAFDCSKLNTFNECKARNTIDETYCEWQPDAGQNYVTGAGHCCPPNSKWSALQGKCESGTLGEHCWKTGTWSGYIFDENACPSGLISCIGIDKTNGKVCADIGSSMYGFMENIFSYP